MNMYDTFMSMFEKGELGQVRQSLMRAAYGQVLEIGVGTGVNLSYYNYKAIESLFLTDLKLSTNVKNSLNEKIKFLKADVQSLPFEDHAFDTVIVSLVFCSVKDVDKGLGEIKRVLKPDGQILFIEHVRPKSSLGSVSDLVTPVWRKIASNCHLNRDFLKALKRNGFVVKDLVVFNKTAFVAGMGIRKATL